MENIYIKKCSLEPGFFPINPKYSSAQSVPLWSLHLEVRSLSTFLLSMGGGLFIICNEKSLGSLARHIIQLIPT